MPEHWQSTTLGGIADVVSGGTPRTKVPEYWGGDIVWVTPTEVVAQEGQIITSSDRMITQEGLEGSSAKMLPVDAVLLTSRATIGAVALAGVPLATNQGFASLVCGEQLLPRFAMYWCQANTHELVSRAGGNTFLEISRKKVAAIPLSIPPLTEQRRIVDLIGSIDAYIDALEAQTEATRALENAAREALFSELWQSEPNSPLGELLEIDRGSSPRPISKFIRQDGSGVPWIRIGDAEPNSKYIERTADAITLEGFATPRFVQPGDFLLSNSMSFGRPYVSKIKGCIHDGWLRFGGVERHFSTDYLYNLMLSQTLQARFTALAAGSGVRNLKIEKVASVSVPVPSKARQDEVTSILETIRETSISLDQQRAAAEDMRTGVLADLLSGERLLTDDYEVAVVL